MKKVFSNAHETIHIFASQSQQEGRSSNVYFNGKSLYSYGQHYEIARFLTPSLVAISTNPYSSTTSKHLSISRQALNHLQRIYIYQVNLDTDRLISHYTSEINSLLIRAAKAKILKDDYLAKAKNLCDEIHIFFNHVHPTFLKELKPIKKLVSNIDLNKLKISIKKEKIRKEKEEQEKITSWINGTSNYLPRYDKTLLRIKNDCVQTSHGATVSLSEAKILFSLIEKKSSIIGHVIEHFTVISYTNNILKIGCHSIPQSEIDRIAPFLKGDK